MRSLLLLACCSVAFAQKKPLTHADYDLWNSVNNMTLSPDGAAACYTLAPVKGDATVVLRNLVTGVEYKFPRGGSTPLPSMPAATDDDQLPTPPPSTPSITGTTSFSPDGTLAFFIITPVKADVGKKDAKPYVAVVEAATGKVIEKLSGIKSFSVTGNGKGLLLVTKDNEPKLETAPMPKLVAAAPPNAEVPPKPTYGNDLIIRDLATGKETTFKDVSNYSLTRDFTEIVYIVSKKKQDENGVYAAKITGPARPIITANGRFSNLTWNDAQTKLAFFFDDSPPRTPSSTPTIPSKRSFRTAPSTTTTPAVPAAKMKVYLWDRGSGDAKLVLSQETPGLKPGWQFVSRGGLSFSADGLKLNISAAPEPPKEEKKSVAPATDKVELDLWHWKDDVIQPMQKIRAPLEKSKSYPGVYLLDDARFVHLADEDRSLRAPDRGDWGIGSSDKKYRGLTWESPSMSDIALVNVRTGEAKTILTAARSGLQSSPDGNYAVGFDGKDWFSIKIPDGTKTNLTGKLKTKFANDQFDMPMQANSYGSAGWSRDSKHFFVHGKHDIWKLSPDGREAVNVTKIGEALNVEFRLARVEKTEDESVPERGLDTGVPWLLSAENLNTHDSGFYRMSPNQEPKLLVMGPRKYGVPFKAKKANTMVFTISTFAEYPDYYTTANDFKEVSRLTDANSHRKNYNWATAEPVKYTSTNGTPLQGILVKPEDFDASKKYPMVVYIYERFSDTIHNYHAPTVTRGQVVNPVWYASNGYLVLIPDIAYTIGSPGKSALDCVLPAIQTVCDKGFVNEKAIGINGQSWGGYQIAYMVTQTNRFKAAVAGAAVSDMVSAYNGIRWGSGMARQFQYEHTQSRIGATLWQAPMKYIENSPVFFADRVQTPLMMIHNDADDAVPWYQGIEYYLSLRRLGKEVYLLNYNNEPHNLAKSHNARDFALRMHQFFEHHLKGAPMPPWMAKGVPYTERDSEKEQWKKALGK